MKTGRPHKFPPCPDCQRPIESTSSPYFECACRGYIVRDGKLCPTRARTKSAEILLSYDKDGRVTGAWVIDKVATAHYSTPRVEKEPVYCTADEYERLAS